MKNGPNYLQVITTITIYAIDNGVSKYIYQRQRDLRREIDNLTDNKDQQLKYPTINNG